jgi:hypothetical protein
MLLLSPPDRQAIRAFIHSQGERPFSYPQVGATRDEQAPKSYTVDHTLFRSDLV